MIELRDLLPDEVPNAAIGAIEVQGLTADSRQVRPGFVFFAVPGAKADGFAYASQAVAAGAIAVVAGSSAAPPGVAGGVPVIAVGSVRSALARAAARFYPGQPATIVAVTGTSGKTSVAAFVRQIWATLGHNAGALGTTGVVTPTGGLYGSLTTPDPVSLHATLDRLAQDGISHLATEASSHGLDQHRLDGVRLAAGAFTNLSRDHLDYHPTLAAYLQAKLALFERLLKPGQAAVIDADSDVANEVIAAARACGLAIFTTGAAGEAIRLVSLETAAEASSLTLTYQGRIFRLRLPLPGSFMAANALVAAGLCIATGSPAPQVFAALERLEGAPGRLERVGMRNGAPIFVDYAHKPDALEKVLTALRPLARGRLIVVFGCGGDRDPGKRPIMGEIAARLADVVIVTDDNPRSEAPEKIRAAILAAAPGARDIGDRRAAIVEACAMLEQGDLLVVAGKGHETGQTIAGKTFPFSDHEVVRTVLEDLARGRVAETARSLVHD
jgi:UDP-N-acetylmuramoyl-L-alanyl-D-glutamate--2,6-diaminopimelate ligase